MKILKGKYENCHLSTCLHQNHLVKVNKTLKKRERQTLHCQRNVGQGGHTGSPSTIDVNKRTYITLGNMQHDAMASNFSFGQPSFGHQFVSSPPFTPFTAVPPWATEILEDIKNIKKSVSKLENIEKTVNRISTKVNDLDLKVKSIDKILVDVENACTFHSETFEGTKKRTESTKTDIKKLDEKCKEFEKTMSCSKEINEKVDELESRSMRENLLFHGIKEDPAENCETLISDLIKTKLDID